jgi:predicted small secreted protein
MKRLLMVLVFLVLASTAYAQVQCTDTDGGGKDSNDAALKVKGTAKVGVTPKVDVCLTSEEGVSINESHYLKEYYCGADKQVKFEVYDCTREGYSGCRDGACYGASSGSTSNTSSSSSSSSSSSCGNEILEKAKGEQCDPPGSICFGKTTAQYGQCMNDCTCKISGAAEPVKAVCGDDTVDSGEDCEKDADCGAGFVCSSCSCVKQLTKEEIEAMKKGEKPVIKDEPKVEPKVDDSKGVIDTTPKNFSDTGTLKATSSVAGFFKAIFGWIGSLFS